MSEAAKLSDRDRGREPVRLQHLTEQNKDQCSARIQQSVGGRKHKKKTGEEAGIRVEYA